MKQWLYSVWFRDQNMPTDEQDYEWCACIVIDADFAELAKQWGDQLSKRYVANNPVNLLLSSDVVLFSKEDYSDISSLPFIKYGYEATEEEIGW